MSIGINESKAIEIVECRCKLDDKKYNLRQKWNNDKY